MYSSILPYEGNNRLDIDYTASGDTINRAERTPGAVAVSGGVRQNTGGGNSLPVLPQTNSEPAPQTKATRYQCGSAIVFTECESGEHHFAKRIICGKEWCPECGEDDSQAHNRRIARWLPKFQQISQLGYFVIEFPDRYRKRYSWTYSRRGLKGVTDRIIEVMAGRRMGRRGRVGGYFSRGLGRWHWFGDKVKGKWNPHFNIAVDGAYIEGVTLAELKQSLKDAVNCPDLIVHYSYFDTPGEIYHKLKYISRATFRNYDWSPYMAEQIYGFRNCRWWGSWKQEPSWELNEAIKEEAEAIALREAGELGSGFCPDCGAPLKKWSRPVDSAYLTIWGAVEIGKTGYYRIPKHEWTGGELSPAVRLRLEELEARGNCVNPRVLRARRHADNVIARKQDLAYLDGLIDDM